MKLMNFLEGCTRTKIYLNVYINWLFDTTLSIQNIPNPIPNQYNNNKQEQRQSKEDSKKITLSTSESLLTVGVRRAVAKAPPFLFRHGGGSWWPRHSGSIPLYRHIGTQECSWAFHSYMLNKIWQRCDTKADSHTSITFILACN